MAEDSGSPRRGPFPAMPALALMLIVSAVVLQVPPLTSSRPQHDPLPELGKGSVGQVRARLWQDPLQAVYAEHNKQKEDRRKGDLAKIKDELRTINDRLVKSTPPGETKPDWRFNLKINRGPGDAAPHPEDGDDESADVNERVPDHGSSVVQSLFFAQMHNLSTISACATLVKIKDALAAAMESIDEVAFEAFEEEVGHRKLLILSVMLQGGPYAEAAENRMRTRYAVLSALGQAGYKPEHAEHLRYVSYQELLYSLPGNGHDGAATPDRDTREFLIPFERWEYSQIVPERGADNTPVYVVWIDEDALKDPNNEVHELDTEFAWRLSRTLGMFERWLSDRRRSKIFRNSTPRAISRIRPLFPQDAWPVLRSSVQSQVQEDIARRVSRIQFQPAEHRVIGPVSSDSWLEMLSLRQPSPPYLSYGMQLPHLKVYCPRATVADQVFEYILRARGDNSEANSQPVEHGPDEFPEEHPYFSLRRTTTTDADLIRSLLKELELRDASPPRYSSSNENVDVENLSTDSNSQNHMVLLGEWDTLYGRARRCTVLNEIFPMSSEKYFCRLEPPGPWNAAYKDAYAIRQPNLHFIGYLRGLDGRTPKDNRIEELHPQGAETTDVELPGELPVGPAQVDYLRRLQQQLEKLQRDLSANNDGELKAIGVIGNDVYDKLLILKALRPHFPRAVFFTTDLDAQMAHPSEYEHTRNLIVASPYGLTLHEDLQRGLPPFRDSYQTATYLTTLYAIEDKDATTHLSNCPDSSDPEVTKGCSRTTLDLPAPRVYEIGRSGAHDLTILDDASVRRRYPVHPDGDVHRLLALVNFHPYYAVITFLFGALLLGPLTLTVMQDESKWYSSKQAKPFREFLKRSWAFVLLFLVVVCGAVYVLRPWEWVWAWYDNLLAKLFREWKNHELEPLVMFQGISAWPTEFLRMIAFFLSLWFVLKIYLRLETSAESLELKKRPSSSEPKRDEAKIDKEDANPLVYDEALQDRNWHQILRMKWKNDPDPVAIKSVWNEYRLFGKLRWRAARACFWALVYFLFGSALFVVLGYPAEPLRGKAIVTIDNVAFYTSVVALLILVFWVLDASRLCDGFVQQISRENVFWRLNQESAKDKTGESRGDRRGNLEKTRLIAALTSAVGQCLWYPFLVLFLLIMSRNSVFDNWDWPLALVSLCVFLVAATLLSGWLPRRSARFARRSALQLVNAERDKLSRSSVGSGKADPRLAYLDHVIDEINAIRTGAFSSVAESPILGAPLIPVGLYGLTELLATLSR